MSVEVAHNFLSTLFGGEKLEQGYILITNLKDYYNFFKETKKAAEEAVKLSAKEDVYFGTGIYGPKIPKTQSGKETDVMGRPAFVFDIDFKGDGHKKKALIETYEEGIDILQQAFPPFTPTIVNMSGGGMHCYYMFKEIVWLNSQDERAEHKEICEKVHNTLYNVFAKDGVKIDSVFNLNRVLRVPGTYNHKNGGNRPVYTKSMQPEFKTSIDDWLPFMTNERVGIAGQQRVREPKACGEGKNVWNITIAEDAQPPYEKLTALIEVNPRFGAIWKCGKAIRKEYNHDFSSMDIALANIMTNCEWTPQEIANTLSAFRRINGDESDRKKGLRIDYLNLTITRSKDKLKRLRGIEDIEEKAKEISVEEDSEKQAEMRVDVFDALQDILNVRITEVRMFMGDDVTFEIDINGVTCQIGAINKMFSQANMRQVISVMAKGVIPKIGAKEWDNIVTILLKSAVEIKLGTCLTEMGVLNDKIQQYLDENDRAEDKDDAYESGRPFIWKGEKYIFIGALRKWMATNNDKTDSKTLGINMGKLGHKDKLMKFRKRDGTYTTRWVYKLATLESDTGGVREVEG